MSNKKVGLCIQFEGVDNYGTALQAVATLKTVNELGREGRLIRYKRKYTISYVLKQLPRLFDSANIKGIKRSITRKKNLKRSSKFKNNIELKKVRFTEFRKKFFPEYLVDTYEGYAALASGSDKYDAFVVGSDQLWLPSGLKTNFYNLNFVSEKVKKISYATSFGVSLIPKRQKVKTAEYLNRINYLSVRELAGAKIIKELTGRSAYVACDPVMLINKNYWDDMIAQEEMPADLSAKSYVLTYFLGGNIQVRHAARTIADKKGLLLAPIKFVEDYYSIDEKYGDIELTGLTPIQFIKLIKNAAYVLTDSFHGTAFSIIYEKKFLTAYRFSNNDKLSKNCRIDTILDKFDLKSRLYVGSTSPEEQILEPIDYDKVNHKREAWQKESLEFLKEALEISDAG